MVYSFLKIVLESVYLYLSGAGAGVGENVCNRGCVCDVTGEESYR